MQPVSRWLRRFLSALPVVPSAIPARCAELPGWRIHMLLKTFFVLLSGQRYNIFLISDNFVLFYLKILLRANKNCTFFDEFQHGCEKPFSIVGYGIGKCHPPPNFHICPAIFL